MLFSGVVPWQHGGGQQTGFSLLGEENVLDKGGQGAKEGRVGAADITLLTITAKRKRAGVPYVLFL